ncbi:hypothetical protein [Microbaculum marinum]|uniref:Uncharacterized protein n=1 Tax=Microbaculum marinum TaxID=1764581 RepID=A0AAW9RIG0_9HYPH
MTAVQTGTGAGAIHGADCSIWDLPADAAPDALIGEGIDRDEVIAYLGAARPVYDAFKRVLGQFAGLLLLSQADSRSVVDLDLPMHTSARDQLLEATERLRAVPATAAVERHRDALLAIAGLLRSGLEKLEKDLSSPRRAEAEFEAMSALLHEAQRRLLAASEPRAGMTPVDFSHACCSCGARKHTGRPG